VLKRSSGLDPEPTTGRSLGRADSVDSQKRDYDPSVDCPLTQPMSTSAVLIEGELRSGDCS
jgi:hypothetical protein